MFCGMKIIQRRCLQPKRYTNRLQTASWLYIHIGKIMLQNLSLQSNLMIRTLQCKSCQLKRQGIYNFQHPLRPRELSVLEEDMGVYGIAVLGFFSYGISVILILTCGIAVSSSSAVCGFSSFWLTVFGEIRLFTVLRYRLFALSFRYNTQSKTQYDIKVNKS